MPSRSTRCIESARWLERMTRKGGSRFSLATNAKRLRGGHAQKGSLLKMAKELWPHPSRNTGLGRGNVNVEIVQGVRPCGGRSGARPSAGRGANQSYQ